MSLMNGSWLHGAKPSQVLYFDILFMYLIIIVYILLHTHGSNYISRAGMLCAPPILSSILILAIQTSIYDELYLKYEPPDN